MAKKVYSIVGMAVVFAAMVSMANGSLFSPISQAVVLPSTGGLTCSLPSPFFFQPRLSGANVTISCNGASNSTTTDASGLFRLVLNFPTPTNAATVIANCRVFVTVPSNCSIIFFFRRVTLLKSTLLAFLFFDPSFPGGSATFRADPFLSA